MKTQSSVRLRQLTLCAVMIALATVLSMIKLYEAPLGGAVTLFSMAPIILISFRSGWKWGLGSGLVYSVIQLLLGLGSVAYVPSVSGIILCVLLDYLLPFTLLGCASIPAGNNRKHATVVQVLIGTLAVCILRYLSHVLSGAVVWYEITKLGGWNDYVSQVGMWTYTFVYNGQFMLPETVITMIAAPVLHRVLLLIKKD